jgi:hypothetical protein
MNSLPDAPPLTTIASMITGIEPNEFDDPVFSDDGSSLLSIAPNSLKTPSFGSGTGSQDPSTSDATQASTAGSMTYKRKRIKCKSYVFAAANGIEYTSTHRKSRWRCMQCMKLIVLCIMIVLAQ